MKPIVYTAHMVTVYLYDMKYIRDISPRSNKRQKNRRDFIDIDKHQIHIPFRFILISYCSLLTAMGI